MKRKGESVVSLGRHVKAKHNRDSTAGTKEDDPRDETDLNRQSSLDSLRTAYSDSEDAPATLSRSAFDSLERKDVEQLEKNHEALADAVLAATLELEQTKDKLHAYMGEVVQADVENERLKEQLKAAEGRAQGALHDLNRQREETDYFEERSRGYYQWFIETEAKLEASQKMERKQQFLIKRQAKELAEERKKAQAFAAANSSHSRHYTSLEQATAMDLDIASEAIAQLTAERDEAVKAKEKLEGDLLDVKALREFDQEVIKDYEAKLDAERKELLKENHDLKARADDAAKKLRRARAEFNMFKAEQGADVTFSKESESVYLPGMFVHVIGTDNEGKRHLWWGQIGKVYPGKRISIERYWEPDTMESQDEMDHFMWFPCSEDQGVPAKDEILEYGTFMVHNRLPVSRLMLYSQTKDICKEQGPLVECTGHTQAEHDAMEARAKAEEDA